MKKGRHRRYEEVRKFNRDSAAQFEVEDYDFEADGFSDILESSKDDSSKDDQNGSSDDLYEDLAKKYDPDSDLAGDADLAEPAASKPTADQPAADDPATDDPATGTSR